MEQLLQLRPISGLVEGAQASPFDGFRESEGVAAKQVDDCSSQIHLLCVKPLTSASPHKHRRNRSVLKQCHMSFFTICI